MVMYSFFFQAEDGIRDGRVTGVQTCALPILIVYVRRSVGLGAKLITETQDVTIVIWIVSVLSDCFVVIGFAECNSWGFRRVRKSTRLNSSHPSISYAVFCLKKKKYMTHRIRP